MTNFQRSVFGDPSSDLLCSSLYDEAFEKHALEWLGVFVILAFYRAQEARKETKAVYRHPIEYHPSRIERMADPLPLDLSEIPVS